MISKITPVFYTDKFLKRWQAGVCFGFFILIKPKYKNDRGLHMHEYCHTRQFTHHGIPVCLLLVSLIYSGLITLPYWIALAGFFTHGARRTLFENYRYQSELEAYAFQLLFITPGQRIHYAVLYAKFITTRYRLSNKYYESKVMVELMEKMKSLSK